MAGVGGDNVVGGVVGPAPVVAGPARVGRRAARLLGAAGAARSAAKASAPPPHRADRERAATLARGQIGGDAFAAAYAESATWPTERAVAEALAGNADA